MRTVVLLVEDDPPSRAALRDYLIDHGYDVLCAGDCSVARELARGRPFDLLITERWLPDWTGSQLIEELGASRPQMTSILLSGQADLPVSCRRRRSAGPVRLERLAEDPAYAIDGKFEF